MDKTDFTTLKMPRRDFFRLPPFLRHVEDGHLMVLSAVRGEQVFVPVHLV
ncbi:hypothetical protein [Collimonas arenae]|nr:hypothetical protein [Collimonas arenae]